MAVTDVYDALRSKRPYKASFTHQQAYDLIIADRGVKFDPKIVDAFMEIHPLFDEIFTENQK